MKAIIAALFLVASINAVATERGNPLQGNTFNNDVQSRSSSSSQALTGPSTSDGGSTRNNLLVLPSAGAAQATNGNADVICPVVTVVSTARGRLFNAWSDAEVGVAPARVNYVCALFHKAQATGKVEDWNAFTAYAKEQDDLAKAKK